MDETEQIDIIQYLKDNFTGIILLFLAFFIIYFVDYINRLNALIYSISSPVTIPSHILSSNKRRFKKR
jgi:succinate dehydrogenase hydrophobic anchor subunit